MKRIIDDTTENPVKLTPEQSQMLSDAEAAYEKSGVSYTSEQVLERARAKVRSWTENPSKSA